MAVRNIITSPNTILRNRATKVRSFTPELQQLIDDMIETLRAAPGVGLAAPQVGIGKRIIVVEYGENSDDPEVEAKPPQLYIVVNPEIVRHSQETVTDNEACLSVPSYFGEVDRYETVTIKGRNRRNKPFRLKAKGWLARVFQHEIDHLNGVLYIDRANQMWKAVEDEEREFPAAV